MEITDLLPVIIPAIVPVAALLTALATAFLGWRELKRKASVDAVAATDGVVKNSNISAQSALIATQTMAAQIVLMTAEIARLNTKVVALDVSVESCQKARQADQVGFSAERRVWQDREDTLKSQVFAYLEKLVATQAAQTDAARAASTQAIQAVQAAQSKT